MPSTKDVIDNHLLSFHKGDLEGILGDYAPEAILFTQAGPLKGRDEIKPLFQALLAEFGKKVISETMHMISVEGEYAYFVWSAETSDNVYELATDTFVVRDGKIVMQSFAANLSPKH